MSGSEPLRAEITGKHASKPLLNVVILPFLKALQQNNPAHKSTSLRMVSSVHVNDELISLNHAGLSIHSPANEVLAQAAGDGFGTEQKPVLVTLQVHPDDNRAKPRYMLSRIATGLHLEPNTASFNVYIEGALRSGCGTDLSPKWQNKPAMEALVQPFLDFYNSLGISVEVKPEDVIGASRVLSREHTHTHTHWQRSRGRSTFQARAHPRHALWQHSSFAAAHSRSAGLKRLAHVLLRSLACVFFVRPQVLR